LTQVPFNPAGPGCRISCDPAAGPNDGAGRDAVTWPRPVPLVGDPTSAAGRAADPAGWALGETTVAALHTVLGARRDVRRYRPDPVPAALLRRILAAGHQAPSVGHSQPWRFIVVSEQATRDRAALLADRERLRQADQLTPERRSMLLNLQLEGIREAPLGVVVACDRRTAATGVLGRATFTDADLWSCACAIQNIWLAARAAGLGLGWVTLFQPADLAGLLHLPEGVETLGWLCLGWPDERPPAPGLERRGWSRRLPLDDVIMAERWPADEPPSAPVSHLAGPGQAAVVASRDSGDDLLTVPGSLGALDLTVNRVLALGPEPPASGTLLVAAADHPVTRHSVSAYPPSVTADVYAATQRGVSLGAAIARQAGLAVEAVFARPAKPAGDLADTDALHPDDVRALLADGEARGARLAERGLVCLGEVGIGNTTVAAALTSVLLDLAPADAVGLGAGSDTDMVRRKQDVVARAVTRARTAHGDRLRDPWVLAASLGGPEITLLAGVVLGAARRRVPVVLDGYVTSVAAALAVRAEPAAQGMLVAGQVSNERAHEAVLLDLGLEPLLRLRLRAGEGVGACLAAQLLLTALRARRETARVTEKPPRSLGPGEVDADSGAAQHPHEPHGGQRRSRRHARHGDNRGQQQERRDGLDDHHSGQPGGRQGEYRGPQPGRALEELVQARVPAGRNPERHDFGGELGDQRLAGRRGPREQDAQDEVRERELQQEEQHAAGGEHQHGLQRQHEG
jgi:nicotinate-nucleotide--dimethylbenzimidazole phosphoribosyltransferase